MANIAVDDEHPMSTQAAQPPDRFCLPLVHVCQADLITFKARALIGVMLRADCYDDEESPLPALALILGDMFTELETITRRRE